MENDQLVIERVFNAPRELVFKAWTEADRLAKWWGQAGSTIEVHKLDLAPGGIFHYSLKGPMGEMWGRFVYKEIIAPERLTFVMSFSDKDCNIAPAPFFDGKWPREIWNELTLTEEGGTTRLKLTGKPMNATTEEMELYLSMIDNMQQGFSGTFAQLDEYLASIII